MEILSRIFKGFEDKDEKSQLHDIARLLRSNMVSKDKVIDIINKLPENLSRGLKNTISKINANREVEQSLEGKISKGKRIPLKQLGGAVEPINKETSDALYKKWLDSLEVKEKPMSKALAVIPQKKPIPLSEIGGGRVEPINKETSDALYKKWLDSLEVKEKPINDKALVVVPQEKPIPLSEIGGGRVEPINKEVSDALYKKWLDSLEVKEKPISKALAVIPQDKKTPKEKPISLSEIGGGKVEPINKEVSDSLYKKWLNSLKDFQSKENIGKAFEGKGSYTRRTNLPYIEPEPEISFPSKGLVSQPDEKGLPAPENEISTAHISAIPTEREYSVKPVVNALSQEIIPTASTITKSKQPTESSITESKQPTAPLTAESKQPTASSTAGSNEQNQKYNLTIRQEPIKMPEKQLRPFFKVGGGDTIKMQTGEELILETIRWNEYENKDNLEANREGLNPSFSKNNDSNPLWLNNMLNDEIRYISPDINDYKNIGIEDVLFVNQYLPKQYNTNHINQSTDTQINNYINGVGVNRTLAPSSYRGLNPRPWMKSDIGNNPDDIYSKEQKNKWYDLFGEFGMTRDLFLEADADRNDPFINMTDIIAEDENAIGNQQIYMSSL